MRVYIVLLALTVFVVAVSAEKDEKKDARKGTKKGREFVSKFFEENPIGKLIAYLANNWNKAMVRAKSEYRASLDKYCRALTNKTA
uniref:8 kDa glycoprotein n=1 Tax=Taenia hydatigena TaxID=85431 RepID=B6E4C2_TAEHY|nr:8 kDa glycoprotein [Taenia hydatigena]